MTTVAEKYLQIAKLAKDPANAEVVIDGILTFFGLDYFDLDLGVEYLYTTKVIDYKFRSVLHKAEDMDAIMAWFKEKAGVTDEEIAAAEAKEKEYVAGCLMLAKQYLGMGHCISGKTYLELAAAKGSEEAIAQLKDMEYAQDMYDLGEHYLAMGHCICSKTYFELAAAKGCPKAAAKLKDMEYAEDMYKLGEQKRPGEYFDLEEDERGTYVMNSKDLCLIEYLPELMRAGVCSLKIEGRMKSVHYVATVVSVYRKAIDQCWADMEHYSVPEAWITELNKVSHRQYTTGFAVAKPDRNAQVYTSSKYEQTHDFVGIVTGYDAEKKRAYFEQRNNVKAGEPLELLMPDGSTMPFVLTEMLDEAGTPIDCAPHAQQKFSAVSEKPLLQFSLLRRKVVKE